jgi:hypothetical protein
MVNTPPVDKLNQQQRSFQLLTYPLAMAYQASSPSWLAAVLALFSIFSLLVPANALYFYVDGRQTKCFFEDLPKDTLVAGMHIILRSYNRCRQETQEEHEFSNLSLSSEQANSKPK